MGSDKEQRRKMRRWLGRYRNLTKEIAAREKHLQDFLDDVYNPLAAVVNDGMPKGQGRVSDQTYSTVERIQTTYRDMIREMEARIGELKKARDEIETAIDSLDEYERNVLYHRFVLGIYWADLPAYIGYEQRQCQRLENSALDKLISIDTMCKL